MDTLTFKELSPDERRTIHRRRIKLTLQECADLMGVHRNTYMRIEPEPVDDGIVLSEIEKAYIQRRRLSMTQLQCAKLMKISRYWFNQMEIGKIPANALIKFWETYLG